jgi:hypothetical protein
VAAAQLQGCAILLTEDLQDGAVLGGVTVRNPFSFRIEDAAGGSYQVAMPSRRRGRPLLAGQPRRKFA